jgi:Htaa
MAALRWGVKSSFRDYVIGVGGTIEVTAPAAEDGTAYRFPLADGADGRTGPHN